MLARVLAVPCVRLSVSVSATSRSSVEMGERIELVFGMETFFHLSCTVFVGNSGIFKNKGTSFWNFVQNSGLRKFSFSISIVETRVIDLARRRWPHGT